MMQWNIDYLQRKYYELLIDHKLWGIFYRLFKQYVGTRKLYIYIHVSIVYV